MKNNHISAGKISLVLATAILMLFSCQKAKEEKQVRFLGVLHEWTNAIKPLFSDFTTETGIQIQFESYTEEQLSNKLTVESTAKSKTLDVFNFRPLQDGLIYAQNQWLEDLNPYVQNNSNYNFADFIAGAVGTCSIGGELLGIPLVTETQLLYYNKDMFDAANLRPPNTLEEMQQVAELLTQNNQFGVVYRGQRSASITQLSSFLQSNGTFYQDKDGNANLLNPIFLDTVRFYGNMLREYGPPGVLNMSWQQAAEVFSQGNVGMYTDASSLFNAIKKNSKVNVGVAPFPEGSKGRHPYNVTSWAISMGKNSSHKENAWQLIEWLTDKKRVSYAQKKGISMARNSAWSAAKDAFPSDFISAVKANSPGSVPFDRPRLVHVQEARDIIGTIVVEAIEGKDITSISEKAQQEFQSLLDSE